MRSWSTFALAAALGAAAALTPVTPAAATGALKLEAEHAALGGVCGDNQAQSTHSVPSGETVVFLGGNGCAVTFTTAATTSAVDVRWYSGGLAGPICGYFAAVQGGIERGRTGRSCSTAALTEDFVVASFAANTVAAGPFQLVWHPETSWLDAHVDWLRISGNETTVQAEGGTFGGVCGDNQAMYAHGVDTGETVVFMGGANCALDLTAAAESWVFGIRWYAGGRTGEICGFFTVATGGFEQARTARTCSTGGAAPDFEIATFAAHVVPAGSYRVSWWPEGYGLDAHVDWVTTTPGVPGPATATFGPASIDFGLRGSGSPSPVTPVTLRATSEAPVTVGALGNTNPGEFQISSDGCGGRRLWFGQSCVVGVRYMPTGAQLASGTLVVPTNAGTFTVTMTGESENKLPESTFTTPNNAILVRTSDRIRGYATDERAGVTALRMYYRSATNALTIVEGVVESCSADRLYCTWSVALPGLPGKYTANSRAKDAVGHWENPGPTISVTVV